MYVQGSLHKKVNNPVPYLSLVAILGKASCASRRQESASAFHDRAPKARRPCFAVVLTHDRGSIVNHLSARSRAVLHLTGISIPSTWGGAVVGHPNNGGLGFVTASEEDWAGGQIGSEENRGLWNEGHLGKTSCFGGDVGGVQLFAGRVVVVAVGVVADNDDANVALR